MINRRSASAFSFYFVHTAIVPIVVRTPTHLSYGCSIQSFLEAMTPKSQTIAPEEWERHRQTITRLYSEKPLKDVMEEMESNHGFKAR